MPDFIPKDDAGLANWLSNIKTKLPLYAATLGLTAAEVTDMQTNCDQLIAQIQDVEAQKTAWQSAAALKETTKKQTLAALRSTFNQAKANPAATPAMLQDLNIVGTSVPLDGSAYKPKLSVESFGGYNRVKFRKEGADGVNIYMRKKGESAWQFLARDTNSPYDDHTPLTTPGTPEVREYQAYGLVGDDQIGQASDIVSATFTG